MGLDDIQLQEGWTLLPHEDYLEPDSHTISYTYNDQGYRTSKTLDGTTISYTLIGDKVIYETDGTYVIMYTYDIDGTIISFNLNDGTSSAEYFYIKNQQGDITKIVNSSGIILVVYKYDAWGNILEVEKNSSYQTEANKVHEHNRYFYRGYRYDEELNLYYLNSRFYNPEIGRFINADGLLGAQGNILGHNMYAYTQNNPVMYSDSTGYRPISGISYAEEKGYKLYQITHYSWETGYFQWVRNGYRAVGNALREEVMADVSFLIPANLLGPLSIKIGVSTIINFEDKYIEFYPHFGFYVGSSENLSGSLGVLQNYNGQGDYRGVFVYSEGGYFIGGGHCFDPFVDYSDATKGYYLDIGKGLFVAAGADYYFWNENFVFDWGN